MDGGDSESTISGSAVNSVSSSSSSRTLQEVLSSESGIDLALNRPQTGNALPFTTGKAAIPIRFRTKSVPVLLKALEAEFNALAIENNNLAANLKKAHHENNATLRMISRLKVDERGYDPSLICLTAGMMPSWEVTMQMHYLDIIKTQEELSDMRNDFNILAGSNTESNAHPDLWMIRNQFPSERSHFFSILGNKLLLPDKFINLDTGNSTPLPGGNRYSWVNESILASVSGTELTLKKAVPSLDSLASFSASEEITKVLPHPAGYVLVQTASFVHMLELSGLQQVKRLDLPCLGLAVHPDGGLLLASTPHEKNSQQRGTVTLYSLTKLLNSETAVVSQLAASGKNITCITPSPNGYLIAYIVDGNNVGVLDLRSQSISYVTNIDKPVTSISFDPWGSRLVVCFGELGAHLLKYLNETWSSEVLPEPCLHTVQWTGNRLNGA